MTTINSAIPRRLRLLLPAALIAAAATLGGSAVGDPATACAGPKEWDSAAHDACLKQAYDDWQADKINKKTYGELAHGCCILSGGKWTPDSSYAAGGYCGPKALETQPTHPGVAPLPGEATQNPAPPPPIRNPGVITETFTPTPASPG